MKTFPLNPDRTRQSNTFTYKLSDEDADLGTIMWERQAGFVLRSQGRKNPVGYLHVIMARRAFGFIPEGHEVFHKDGDKANCTRGNLDHRPIPGVKTRVEVVVKEVTGQDFIKYV